MNDVVIIAARRAAETCVSAWHRLESVQIKCLDEQDKQQICAAQWSIQQLLISRRIESGGLEIGRLCSASEPDGE